MTKIQADQIEVGAGPQHALPKYGPGPGWELIASRVKDDNSSIDLVSLLINIGDFLNALNGSHIFIDDVSRIGRFGVGNSPTSKALLNMDCENSGQAVLSAVEGANSASLSLRPSSSGITLGFSPATAGAINLAAGTVNLTADSLTNLITPSLKLNGLQLGVTSTVALTGQTASTISPLTLLIDGGTPPAGLYRLSYYLVTTVAGTSGTVKATFGWTDPGAGRSVDSATLTFGALASPVSGSLIIRSSGALSISCETTVTDPVGDPEYALYITLERLQ